MRRNPVSRWLKGTKNLGDAVARKIEIAARKPQFWLDTDHVLSLAAGAEHDDIETEIGMIAACNLTQWMEGHKELSSQQKVANKSGVSQATIQVMPGYRLRRKP